jgi:NADH-quinone oxidoreductase subunit N
MVYGISGSLNIAEIATFANNAELASREVLVLNFGLVFLVIGIAFKHQWQ